MGGGTELGFCVYPTEATTTSVLSTRIRARNASAVAWNTSMRATSPT
jgi:hypothetical protein